MFQTKVEISSSYSKITYQSKIMTLGSCFAENMGKKMQELYFETDINPFGVLYNPTSICKSIKLLLKNKSFSSADLFENRGLWQSFSHSSKFTATRVDQCLQNINERMETAVSFLQNSDYLLITFGSAWVYEERESGSVVSNCHKLPANRFVRRRLTVQEIVDDYSSLITELANKFPNLKLIFSVSPIRHWKDGAHENNISKSTLLLAINSLQDMYSDVQYFPAFEIQLDELRDYRFYASDMLHPSDVAVEYIWTKFLETYFDKTTIQTLKEIEKFKANLAHRPLNVGSEDQLAFERYLQKEEKDIQIKYPFMKGKLRN
jgi:hypothetical protein